MMEKVYEYVPQFMLNNSIIWGLLLYWLPMVVCAVYYSQQFVVYYRKDLAAREGTEINEFYRPQLTVGAIISSIVVIGMPILNLLYAVCKAAPVMFAGFFSWCGRMFTFPIVPDTANHKESRIQKVSLARARERESRAAQSPWNPDSKPKPRN